MRSGSFQISSDLPWSAHRSTYPGQHPCHRRVRPDLATPRGRNASRGQCLREACHGRDACLPKRIHLHRKADARSYRPSHAAPGPQHRRQGTTRNESDPMCEVVHRARSQTTQTPMPDVIASEATPKPRATTKGRQIRRTNLPTRLNAVFSMGITRSPDATQAVRGGASVRRETLFQSVDSISETSPTTNATLPRIDRPMRQSSRAATAAWL
jgi:hypothetical protein